jgi:quercetin dioxygenase-like cupin family protein
MPATLPETAPHGLWFMGAHLTIHLAQAESAAGVSMIEHRMPEGFAVPLHHHEEDETFYILDGLVRFRVGDALLDLGPGRSLHVPAGRVHAFRVVSPTGRFLTVTTGRFEAMVRALARPAPEPVLPPVAPPTPEETARLVATCAAHGIAFVGPPID